MQESGVVLCCVVVEAAMLSLSDASAGCGRRVTGCGWGLGVGAEQAVTPAWSHRCNCFCIFNARQPWHRQRPCTISAVATSPFYCTDINMFAVSTGIGFKKMKHQIKRG